MIIVGTVQDVWSCRKCGSHSHVMLELSTKFGWCPECEDDYEKDDLDRVNGMMYDLKHSSGVWIHTRVVL